MKVLAAGLAVAVTAMAFALVVLAELVARLAPLLLVGAAVWVVLALHRGRRRDRPATPVAEQRAAPGAAGEVSAPPLAPPLPPMMVHHDRVYVVRGDDTGLLAQRADGYVKVSASALPAPRPLRSLRAPELGQPVRRRRRPSPKARPGPQR
ncbi:hypothetical protein [Mycobacterium simiae]|uniref:hypothetical protein n=1 Tax=Mycobacterium simiae TaxID=1784 RepID=UPI00261685B9|nr:hypothetical protein [Mycobacterium simiae]